MWITPHSTGHVTARDGHLLRVDREGERWVAIRYRQDGVPHDVFYGSDVEAHRCAEHWRLLPARHLPNPNRHA